MFKHGDKIDFYKSLQERNLESPMDNLPVLGLVETLYYNDFSMLESERVSGMNIGAIPITRVISYANMDGVHDIELFKSIITKLDSFYLSLVYKKQQQTAKRKPKKT